MTSARRVAQRYRQAQEDDRALDAFVDHWLDEFLNAFEQSMDIREDTVEKALKAHGVSAEKVNDVTEPETRAAGNFIQALGGRIVHGVWRLILSPFLNIAKFIGSEDFRSSFKRHFRRALSHQIRASRHVVEVAGRLARGEEVNPQERKEAMRQFVFLLSKAVFLYFSGPAIAHFFASWIWGALGAPFQTILGSLIDKPFEMSARKLLGA